MSTICRSEEADKKILEQHFPNKNFIDDMQDILAQAEGMVGLIGDAAALGQEYGTGYQMDMDNLEQTMRVIGKTIKDATIILNDYWYEQRKGKV